VRLELIGSLLRPKQNGPSRSGHCAGEPIAIKGLMTFRVGDWVKHPTYGNGQILTEDDRYFSVRFVSHPETKILRAFPMEVGAPPHPGFEFKHKDSKSAGSKPKKTKPAHALSFDHLVERFLALFPGGFEDSRFDSEERQYKQAARAHFSQQLSREEMVRLLNRGDFAEIAQRAKQITTYKKMNLIFPNENMGLSDGRKSVEGQKRFSEALFDLLNGESGEEERFERYVDALSSIGSAKWTIATFYQFLSTNGASMFMKPMSAQMFADATGFDLMYQALPNWTTYQRLNELAEIVRLRLADRGMVPRHGIDLQGFMYRAWDEAK
jgi:hypothetical protein